MTVQMWTDLLAAPTALRTVGRGDYPYPGTVRAGVPPRVWVDAEELAALPTWRLAADGHLLAPVDIARTDTGHAALMPLCPQRLVTRLQRSLPLTAGEAVNIAVSLVRGAAEASVLDADDGSWWITDDGRPVLALGGGASWRDETRALLRMLAAEQDASVITAIDAADDLVADEQAPARRWAACDDALLAAAAPVALNPHVEPPSEARPEALRAAVRDAADAPPHASRAVGSLLDRVMRMFDGDLADRLRRAVSRPSRRATPEKEGRSRPSRRTPWLVAAAVAATIVVAGALWPDDAPSSAQQPDTAPAATPAGDSAGATPADGDAPPAAETPAPTGAVQVGADLLDRLGRCLEAAEDCEDVREDATRPVPPGVATSRDGDRELTVLDEYGGVTVLRAGAEDDAVPEQIVVIVRDGDGWLIRDVYDIAGQQ